MVRLEPDLLLHRNGQWYRPMGTKNNNECQNGRAERTVRHFCSIEPVFVVKVFDTHSITAYQTDHFTA
jgi:hypothetical protein